MNNSDSPDIDYETLNDALSFLDPYISQGKLVVII
jgi:hypothetical protein